MISFEDFQKVELKTAKIMDAQAVDGSEKLVKLMLDAGEGEQRQILAGIKKWYQPEDLVGRTVVIAANLEPRMIMGLESQGMLLAADGEKPVLLTTFEATIPGSKIR